MRKARGREAVGELNMEQLTEAEKALVREYADSLDPKVSNSLAVYGVDIQKNLAQLAHILLGNLNSTGVDSTGEILQKTVDFLDMIEKEEGKSVLFWQKKAQGLRLRSKYDQALAEVEKIESNLKELQVKLLMDNAMLDQLCKMNEDYYHQLQMRVQAAKIRHTELKTDASVDYHFLVRIENRIQDLEMTKSVASQQSAQLQVLKDNSSSMVEGVQSVLYHVIPLWKSSIASARSVKQAMETENLQRKINNQMLRESLGEITRLKKTSEAQNAVAEKEFTEMEQNMKEK